MQTLRKETSAPNKTKPNQTKPNQTKVHLESRKKRGAREVLERRDGASNTTLTPLHLDPALRRLVPVLSWTTVSPASSCLNPFACKHQRAPLLLLRRPNAPTPGTRALLLAFLGRLLACVKRFVHDGLMNQPHLSAPWSFYFLEQVNNALYQKLSAGSGGGGSGGGGGGEGRRAKR